MDQSLIEYLSGFVSNERLNLYHQILNERTRYVTVVLEEIFQTHNASAVLRSCDCFGIQDLYTIENRNDFNVNIRVTRGSDNWITHHQYNHEGINNTPQVITQLKAQGYRIVATTPREESVSLPDFDVSKGKFALIFGNERTGISPEVADLADEFLTIPMYGFTESLNISVSVAIILNHMVSEIRKVEGVDWHLQPEERSEILLGWLRQRIKKVHLIENEFQQKKVNP